MSHIRNIEKTIGGLQDKKILDVGAGFGEFVIECRRKGYDAVGIELNPDKITKAKKNAQDESLQVEIMEGSAENLPFNDREFDFINVGEVIEHVRDPLKVLKEIQRVLKPGGRVYISVHNRYGFYDTHFHVYFLGWLPRFMAHFYLSLLGKHKNYAQALDLQDINDMHYYSFGSFKKLASGCGFIVQDIRSLKIKRYPPFKGNILRILYPVFRAVYFSTFHVLLSKPDLKR